MNPYKVLGVAPGASAAEVKAAHRGLARILHPDRAGGREQEMAQVNVAYELLSDPVRRRRYDLEHNVAASKCPKCGGAGHILKQKGFTVKIPVICPKCQGAGTTLLP